MQQTGGRMRSPDTGKVQTLHAMRTPAPGCGEEKAARERELKTELAALNALFEAAATGEEGEAFARSVSALLEKPRP